MEDTLLSRAIVMSPDFRYTLLQLYASSDEFDKFSQKVRHAFAEYEPYLDYDLILRQQEFEVTVWRELYAEDKSTKTAVAYASELALLANYYAINNLIEKAEQTARLAYAICAEFYKTRRSTRHMLFFDASRQAIEALSLCRLAQRNYTSALKYSRLASVVVNHGLNHEDLKRVLLYDYNIYESVVSTMRIRQRFSH